jgi:MFS family permease
MSRQKLWTKDFIILMCTSFFIALSFYTLMTTMAAYTLQQFQASESSAGLAASIFVLAAVFSRLLTGKYVELIGRKKILYSSLAVFLLASLFYLPIENLYLLLAVRFLHGAAFGSASTAMMTAVMSLIPGSRRGEGTSYFSLSSTAATAIGPFLGLFISQRADYSIIFIVCSIFAFLSIVITLFAKIPEITLTPEQHQQLKQRPRPGDFFEKNVLPISFIMILMGIAYSSIVSFINTYANEIHLTEAASYFFVVYAIFLFASRPFTGKLLDRKGDNIVIYPSLVLFAASLLMLSTTEHSFTFLMSGALAALGFGTIMSAGQAIAIKATPKHRYGLATSTFFICLDGGVGVGPFFLGILVPKIGYAGMYLTLSVIVSLTIFIYYLLHGKRAAASLKEKQPSLL